MQHSRRDASRIEIAASLDNLGQVRDFVGARLDSSDLQDDAAGDLLLAVDEAVSNIVMHGRGEGRALVEVAVSADSAAVTVCIRDTAMLFDPTGTVAPRLDVSPLEREQAGGYGVELVRRLVDQVRYRVSDDGRNELTLVKRLRTGAGDGRAG